MVGTQVNLKKIKNKKNNIFHYYGPRIAWSLGRERANGWGSSTLLDAIKC